MKSSIIIFFLLLTVMVIAQHGERQYYEVPDFSGGIQVNKDSASLNPNEMLVAENLTFNRLGALKKRFGYQYWDSLQFPTGDTIKDIHYLFRSKGSNQLLIGTNKFVYASPFDDTTTVAGSWNDMRIGYNKGTVDAYDDSNLIYGTNTWWLLAIKVGDSLEIDNDSIFAVDSIIADTCIELDRKYQSAGDHDTASSPYQVYRTMVGEPYITSWNSNGYIADKHSPPFYYADSQCYWLNCVDSGTIDSFFTSASVSIDVDTIVTVYYYVSDNRLSRIIGTPGTMADTLEQIVVDSGVTCLVRHEIRSDYSSREVTRTLVNQYMGSNTHYVTDMGSFDPGDRWEAEEAARIWTPISIGNSVAISDTSKAWDTDEYTGYFFVRGVRPDSLFTIIWNGSNQIGVGRGDSASVFVDTMFNSPHRYYIFEAIPYGDHPDTVASPYFNQILFHKNVLFASGYNVDENSDTVNTGFVYHSDIGLPKRWSSFEGFTLSLDAQDKITSYFKLGDALFISTNAKIFKLMGWPDAIGNGALIEIMPNFGIDSYHSVAVRDKNYAYIARNDGFYIFNGATVEKMGRAIDPLIDDYRSDQFKVGYFDENVYFSFADSEYTFVYYEPTQSFTKFDFGIGVMNNQATTVDSGYFLFVHNGLNPRRIYKFPTSSFTDDTSHQGSANISFKYKIGLFDFGKALWKKNFEKFYIPLVKRGDTLTVRFRIDFDTTTQLTVSIVDSASAQYVYRTFNIIDLPSTLSGRYLQIEIEGESALEHIMGKWGIKWSYVTED